MALGIARPFTAGMLRPRLPRWLFVFSRTRPEPFTPYDWDADRRRRGSWMFAGVAVLGAFALVAVMNDWAPQGSAPPAAPVVERPPAAQPLATEAQPDTRLQPVALATPRAQP